MHAVGVLQKLLQDSIPSLHLNRLRALISTVRSAMTTRRLTLSGLARGLPTGQAIRHRIKRVDRLLGNRHLHNERPLFYQLLCRQFMVQDKRPVILVDWSDLKADRSWLVLRAALWIRGAAVPIYESVHPLRDQNSPSVERSFLTQLKSLLPQGLRPIVVTDAGFRGPWFTYLNQLGWYWVGRIRGRTFLRSGDDPWRRCTADYARANARPSDLGEQEMIRSCPVQARLVLYRKPPQQRQALTQFKQRKRSSHSEVCARRESEPWLLCASPSLTEANAHEIVEVYRKRMSIECTFRSLKSHQFGFSFEDSQSAGAARLQILLLIHALATFLLWLVGKLAESRKLRPAYESNNRKDRRTISLLTLGAMVYAERVLVLTEMSVLGLLQTPLEAAGPVGESE
ncbi:IS4 family transposase IS1481A [Achromobacter deleyi]|uniref:IS4 family transposase IS1481A n=1 Tax=Achromobacter deleyi TaxID=1353891 RepID=A0A6S7BSB2_9BURK|nr:IS4 family transposase IS1481A [Achromobacter deleyi]CAB3928112.1 IS4 family transposase IS1481A [Achromobacter deleyi]CAB3928497.1 IS4 family transposase IS1481A [Achromobacter deleyi]